MHDRAVPGSAHDLFVPAPIARRGGLSDRTTLGWCLAISAFVHLAVAWRLTFGLPGFATRGEQGHEGAGGATFEVSLRGPEADVPVPLPTTLPSTPANAAADPRAPRAQPT